MTVKKLIVALIILIALLGGFIAYQVRHNLSPPQTYYVTHEDHKITATSYQALTTVPIKKIVRVHTVADIRNAIQLAKQHHLKVAITGTFHSQGGQNLYPNAVLLDMRPLNSVLHLDTKRKLITVQAGITWGRIQRTINPHGLAVLTAQSMNIFSVGGSLSANIHGRDPHHSVIINSVEALKIMLASEKIVTASRTENPELFNAVIGGYGLFGVITQVTLKLTDNKLYRQSVARMPLSKLPHFIQTHVVNQEEIKLLHIQFDLNPKRYLENVFVAYFTLNKNQNLPNKYALKDRPHSTIQFLVRSTYLNLIRHSKYHNQLAASYFDITLPNKAGKVASRNNVMGFGKLRDYLLNYYSPDDADYIQEYFIPITQLPNFIQALKHIVASQHVHLLDVTSRFVGKTNQSLLTYSSQDSLSVRLFLNFKRTPEGVAQAKTMTRALVDAALRQGGTYYLTYQLFPTKQHLKTAYPAIDTFFQLKIKYDPSCLFMNLFFKRYGDVASCGNVAKSELRNRK